MQIAWAPYVLFVLVTSQTYGSTPLENHVLPQEVHFGPAAQKFFHCSSMTIPRG